MWLVGFRELLGILVMCKRCVLVMRYFLAILIIGLVSTYDTVLTHITSDQLIVECPDGGTASPGYYSNECNPICEWVISVRGISGLVEYKAAGVILATLMLSALYYTKYRRIIWVALAAQLLLFWVLNFSCVLSTLPTRHDTEDVFVVPRMVADFYMRDKT